MLEKYKELGIHFSLDDFASYSSSIEALGMLKTNRFNIDNKFCKHIFNSKEALESINMIRFVADKFGLNATIKNIDDKRTLEFLLGLGFDKFQGNIFSLALLAKDAALFKFERPYLHIKDYKNSENFKLFKGLVVLKELANEVIANLNQDDKLAQSLKQKIEDEIKNIGKF
ncbi:EAL domain-containing protein [Campylobacter concisus]